VVLVPNHEVTPEGTPDSELCTKLKFIMHGLGYGFVDYGEETATHTEMWFYKE
jgi:hypothetical protein